MYERAIKGNNYMALKILFENEIFIKENSALSKIFKYNLIENSVRSKDCGYVNKILSYKDFNFKYLKYEEILIIAINSCKLFFKTSDMKIIELLAKYLLKSPYSNSVYKNTILNITIKNGRFALVKYLIENEDFKYRKKLIQKI